MSEVLARAALVWRRREIDERKAIVVSAILIGLGVLGTLVVLRALRG